MKRIILAISAALSIAACQKPVPAELSEEAATLSAKIEQSVQSKTELDENNNILWSENDQIIGYIRSSYGYRYQVKPEFAGKPYADFSKVSSASGDDLSAGIEMDHIVAYYPYSESVKCSRNDSHYQLDVVLPAEQTYAPGSFGFGAFPMVAVSPDNSITFRNVCGGMKLQLKGSISVSSIKVEGKNGEKLSGSAVITAYTDEQKPVISMGPESSAEVVLNCAPEVKLNQDTPTEFIIALPPVEFTKGFTVTVTDTENRTHTIETNKSNTVLRSRLLKMPVVAVENEEGNTPQTSYWAGKKFIINGDSVVYGSGLSSVYDGFSYLVAEHFGMDITNYAIGGSVIARRGKDYDECFTSKAEWEAAMNAGLLNTKKKYLVNTESGAPRIYRIYSYKNSKWTAGGNTSDATGRVPLSDRIRAMDTDADVIMIMAGSNDFYYNWTAFGDFEAGKNRESLDIDPNSNLLESDGVELVHKGAPPASSPNIDFSYPAYFTYCKIPVVGGCEVKVPYGRRGWWLDKDGKGISNKNFTSEVADFTATAPYNAAYLTVCFKYEEVNPEDCVVYMSVPTDKNAPNETFCDGLHKLCRYLCDTYKDKDIIFLTPIKRKQPKGTSGGTWDCLDPDATNAEGKTLIDYRDAIIEACEYYSIPYIDMYTLSGLDPHTDPSLFADTDGRAVHPNEEGHRIFADALIEQMLKLKR